MNTNFDLNRAFWFVKIIDAGNISRAAELHNTPKAKLSRDLSLLEEELGIQLVYRTTRQFKLTEAGLIFYQSAKDHLEAIMDSVGGLKEEGQEFSGTLKVTAPDDVGVYVVNDIISEFISLYPKVNFEVIYTNEVIDLVKLGVDVAFRIGQLKDSSLIHKKVGTVGSILVASPKYLNRFPKISAPEDILSHQTIGFSARSGAWQLVSKARKKSITLKHKLIANNFIAIKDLTLNGHGIGFIPRFLCEASLASGELVHLLKPWSDQGSPIQIVLPHQKKISGKNRAFLDFAAKRMSDHF